MVRGQGQGQPQAGDASARRPVSPAQCHADGQLHLRRPAEKCGDHWRRPAGSPRGARHVLRIGRPGQHRNAGMGDRQMPATYWSCTAVATRSAATPSRTSAPATSTRPRSPMRSPATAIISARSIPQSRSIPSPIRSAMAHSRASSSSRSTFQTCRSIVPGVNFGSVDLQFLRAMPLIDRQMTRDGIDRAFDEAETNNGWLIFYGHDVTERPSPYGCSPDLLRLCAGSGIAAENSGSHHGGGVPMRARLNALFAFSVNSPSMSMVNFSCCVVSVLPIGAHGVTRRVTPQPMRAAFGTEAGVDAQL